MFGSVCNSTAPIGKVHKFDLDNVLPEPFNYVNVTRTPFLVCNSLQRITHKCTPSKKRVQGTAYRH